MEEISGEAHCICLLEALNTCSLGARSKPRERSNRMAMKLPDAPVYTRTVTLAEQIGEKISAENKK